MLNTIYYVAQEDITMKSGQITNTDQPWRSWKERFNRFTIKCHF